MSSSKSSVTHACAHCGLEAKSFCKGCKGAPGPDSQGLVAVWYCGASCQKKDWASHKALCKQTQARRGMGGAQITQQTNLQHLCAHCGGEATLDCKTCKGAPDSTDLKCTIVVWYCGANCQKADRAKHKAACKAAQSRKALFRAGSILTEAWDIFKRITNMWTIDRIEKLGNLWLLYPPKKYPGDSHLLPFPPACVTTEEEETALLNFNTCRTAMQCAHGLAKVLLQGFCKEVLEVDCYVKNRRIRLVRVFQNDVIDGTPYRHVIYKVTLHSGEQYALDLTGAQYGWAEFILPWDVYEASRIHSIKEAVRFGQNQKEFRGGLSKPCGRLLDFHNGLLDEFGRALDEAVDVFQIFFMKRGWLHFPDETFRVEKGVLLDHMRQRLEFLKAYSEEKGFLKTEHGDAVDFDLLMKSGHKGFNGASLIPIKRTQIQVNPDPVVQ